MNRFVRLGAVLALLVVMFPLPASSWWQDATGPAYQVLVYSYADSDQDGWGDLPGLTHRLNAIASLGVQTLWLSPIHPAGSYHGYDVINYKAVDPKLGTLQDFDTFVAAAHKRGIHVVLDMVFNHTSAQHPWFQSFLKDKNSPYRNYYQWKKPNVDYGQTSMGSWYQTAANPSLSYFSAFWDQMPDLDNSNPAVVDEEKSVLKFWLDRGVDGFRFDAAREIFNAGEVAKGSSTLALTRAYWNSLRDYARTVRPDVFFIGEVPTKDSTETKAYAPAFDSLFDFATANLLVSYSATGRETGLATTMERSLKQYKTVAGFIPAPFLSNHDQDRVMTTDLVKYETSGAKGWGPALTDDERSMAAKEGAIARARVQAAIYLTLPGMPFIYYGEELGLAGRRYLNDDVARRDAMRWGDDDPLGDTVSWTQESKKLEPEQNIATPTWSDQDGDKDSFLTLYRQWGQFRKAHPVLSGLGYSATNWPGLNKGTLIGYTRDGGSEVLVVTANLGDDPQAFTAPEGKTLTPLLGTGKDAQVDGTAVTLAARSLTVWSLK